MRLLAVFAHPDDELGCVGTLARHAARGDDVMLAWTTHRELASQFRDTAAEDVRCVRREHGAYDAEALGAEHTFFDMGDSHMTGGRDEGLALARRWSPAAPRVARPAWTSPSASSCGGPRRRRAPTSREPRRGAAGPCREPRARAYVPCCTPPSHSGWSSWALVDVTERRPIRGPRLRSTAASRTRARSATWPRSHRRECLAR